MKRFFLVEASTEYSSLFCYELTETSSMNYAHASDDGSALFNNSSREQFFGNLNSLCITKQNIQAEPINLSEPNLTSPVAATPTTEQEPI